MSVAGATGSIDLQSGAWQVGAFVGMSLVPVDVAVGVEQYKNTGCS